METKQRVWPLLGKLSEADEAKAFAALRDALEKYALCMQRQQRLLAMREDYEKQLVQGGGRIQGGRDIAIFHNFILHIEGLQKLLQQQIDALQEAIDNARRAYDQARLNTAKWSHLEERDAATQQRRRSALEQKRIDETAAVRFALRSGR